MKPEHAAIISALTFAAGFALRWVLPPARSVARSEVERLAADVEEADRAHAAALLTPDLGDDERARRVRDAVKAKLLAAKRLQAFLDGIVVA